MNKCAIILIVSFSHKACQKLLDQIYLQNIYQINKTFYSHKTSEVTAITLLALHRGPNNAFLPE